MHIVILLSRIFNLRAAKRTIPFLPVLILFGCCASATAADPLASDTLRILALRAEFVSDNLATTTGDGKFDLSTTSTYKVDRPPHNRTYFQHQLKALHNYFNRVSIGRVVIQADVFPTDENRAYTLPQNMVYYSGQENEETKKIRWSELLRDALLVAEGEGGIDFKRYNSFFVFHAGVGSDFAFDFDTTPYDIQSVYLDFATLRQTLGKDAATYQGISIAGTWVRDGVILPETQNQESLDLGLLGTMTLLTGSQLGMPTLFESDNGRAGIGMWGLMDQGSYNFQGLVPAEPSAWEKVYMGWEVPTVVRQGEDVRIGCSSTHSAPHIIKVPIDAKEYFLIENRVRDRNRDHITIGRDEAGHRVQFDSTGKAIASGDFGVLTRIDEYDFGLPGDGLLIWHIDERIIAANLADNTINDDRDHRGVDLVECDGAQDIGYVYDLFDAASGSENGDYYDAYWNANESHKMVNHSSEVIFSPHSIPNSNSYSGAISHITIDQFSSRDTVMTIRIRSDLAQNGFPLPVPGSVGKTGLLALDLGSDKGSALFAASRDGRIWAWRGDGHALPDNGHPLFATLTDSVDLPLAGISPSSQGLGRIVAVDRSGHVSVWLQSGSSWSLHQSDLSGQVSAGPMILSDQSNHTLFHLFGMADGRCLLHAIATDGSTIIKSLDLAAGAITGLAQYSETGSNFLLATATGLLVCCSSDLQKQWQVSLSAGSQRWQPIVADFTRAAGLEAMVLSDAGACWFIDQPGHGTLVAQWPAGLSDPAAGDLDDDGFAELLLTDGAQLYVYEMTGVSTANFPFSLGNVTSSTPLSPLSLDTSSDPNHWAYVAGANGLIWGLAPSGRNQAGFPITAGGEIKTNPVLHDLDQDGDIELLVIGPDQQVNAWSLSSFEKNSHWSQWGATSCRNFMLIGRLPVLPDHLDLMPSKKVFCYPNPTQQNATTIRYTLNKEAESVTIRIFDLAGDLVQELPTSSIEIGDHEVIWKVDTISSGVYLARVQAQAGSESMVTFIKIAVIK